MTKENKIGFRLTTVNTEQFALFEENYSSEEEHIEMKADLNFGIDVNAKGITTYFELEVIQKEHPLIKIEVSGHFQISQDSWNSFLSENGKTLTIPKGFARHMGVITVGTTRGILHAKLENTGFSWFLLPTIDLTGIVKEDVNIPLEAGDKDL